MLHDRRLGATEEHADCSSTVHMHATLNFNFIAAVSVQFQQDATAVLFGEAKR
jgi:hypothetical protein